MRHKNIAVLMTALDSEAQTSMLKGIEMYGKNHDFNIAVFLWFTGAFEKEKHNLGEINIVNLPDLNLFDGVILFANTLHVEENRKKIEKLLKKLTCPIVCVGAQMEGVYCVETDNYTAMRELVEHFIVDHGMRRIHFVKGVEGNHDAEERFRAYVDVLTEHDITVEQERITQGDFYVSGGEMAAEQILNSSLPFPEAVVCANDIMAVSLCDVFKKNGYRIPENIVVSGYDSSVEGQNYSPRITTVRSRFFEMGSCACQMLVDAIHGEEPAQSVYLPDEVILDESCGCKCKSRNVVDIEKQYQSIRGVDMARRKMIHYTLMLEKSIMEGDGFDDWLSAVKEFVSQINPSEFYYCINENFIQDVFEMDLMEQEEMNVEEWLAYSEMIKPIIAYRSGIFKDKATFESRWAFEDMFKDTEKCKMYLFSPVHYLEKSYGYFVFVDSEFPMDNQLYISWLLTMGDSIENIRKQNLLKNAMKRLDEMYIRDSLTGAYNRFGMERFFAELKHKCMMSRLFMQLSFVDLDGLKQINDKYGHEEGDAIISATATILIEEAEKFYVIRYGGDEFIVMGAVHNAGDVEKYWNRVRDRIEQYNQYSRRRAKLSMSFGYELFKMEPKTYLEACIRVCDQKMYMVKNEKKATRNTTVSE